MVEYKESIREDAMKALENGIDMDPEIAVKVVEIKETNSFHNGVCLRMSRSMFLVSNQTNIFFFSVGSTIPVEQTQNISGMRTYKLER